VSSDFIQTHLISYITTNHNTLLYLSILFNPNSNQPNSSHILPHPTMAFKYMQHTALFAGLLQFAAAQQQSKIVPQDLQSAFSSSDTALQVSYTNKAVDGFADGTSFSKDGKIQFLHISGNEDQREIASSQEPTFALGDSAGISPTTLYTIIMVDTTCANKRVLHYARANFKNNLDITNIATQSKAALEYKAPGSLGETGDDRQYSFLMYLNPGRKQLDQLQLPAQGAAFDAKKFQTDNGLSDPTAGVGMTVKLGGQANCDGGAASPSGAPDSVPSARPQPSSAAAPASSAVASSAAAVIPTPSAAVPSSRAQVTSAAASRTPQRPSSAANASPTSASSPSNDAPANTPDNDNSNESAPAQSGARTSARVPVSSVLQSDGLATVTVPSNGSPNGGAAASRTASASLVQQSVNAAIGMSTDSYGLLMPLLAAAGMAMW
jgi:hypothetical protein